MENIRVRQDVALIFIVTEELKARLQQELNTAEKEMQAQIDKFDFQARTALAELQQTDLNRAMAARQQIDAEKRRMEAMKQEVLDRKKEIDELAIGSEYPRGTIEGNVDIAIGDNLFEKIAGNQIIIKDGIVTEIRTMAISAGDMIIPTPGQLSQDD